MVATRLHRIARILTAETYPKDFGSHVDPALLTWEEFHDVINPRGKHHPDTAYNHDLKRFNERISGEPAKSAYPELLFRKVIRGLNFEFRLKKEARSSSNEEKQRYWYSIGVFEGDNLVGIAQDEWGTVLVSVAQEYRGFGLGTMLTKMAYELEPGKDSGGMTRAGYEAARRAHAQFVREYLRKGYYSHLIKNGKLTPQRVKEILASIGDTGKAREDTRGNLNTNASDLLLYAKDGAFILYDRKLKNLIAENNEDTNYYWYGRLIKGFSFAGGGYHDNGNFYLHQLGGDNVKVIQFMMTLALSFSQQDSSPLKIYDDDLKYVDPQTMKVDANGLATLLTAPIDYRGMAAQEVAFRKSFDKYGEFGDRLLELADSKYRD